MTSLFDSLEDLQINIANLNKHMNDVPSEFQKMNFDDKNCEIIINNNKFVMNNKNKNLINKKMTECINVKTKECIIELACKNNNIFDSTVLKYGYHYSK